MRLVHTRYAKRGRTVLGFIPIVRHKTILTLEDAEEMLDVGFYHLRPHNGRKFKNTFVLVGSNSSVLADPNIEKSTCVYHGGDTHEHTTGCPLVGISFHFDGNTPNLDGCAEAMKILRSVLVGCGPHYATILEDL